MAEVATVPVGGHLDHSGDLETVKRANNCGFSTVMFGALRLKHQGYCI
ncbi:class II fructose-bisphosphate aldolase [Bengtsoniella intestinalis]